MALRAGYYGIKKSVLRTIEGLAGSKLIKTIGNGLKLTNAGTLSVDIDSDTMEFKNGKLSVIDSGGSYDYSTSEFDTGQKWINGKSIYGIVKPNLTLPVNSFSLNVEVPGATQILKLESFFPTSSGAGTGNVYYQVSNENDSIIVRPTVGGGGNSTADVLILYLK